MNNISILLVTSIGSIWLIGSISIIMDMIMNNKLKEMNWTPISQKPQTEKENK